MLRNTSNSPSLFPPYLSLSLICFVASSTVELQHTKRWPVWQSSLFSFCRQIANLFTVSLPLVRILRSASHTKYKPFPLTEHQADSARNRLEVGFPNAFATGNKQRFFAERNWWSLLHTKKALEQ